MTRVRVPVEIVVKRTQNGQGSGTLIAKVKHNSQDLAKTVSNTIYSQSRRRVHVITGRLRDSITLTMEDDYSFTVMVGAHYGIYEEFGTRYRPPHPYFRPALEMGKQQLRDELKKVFE